MSDNMLRDNNMCYGREDFDRADRKKRALEIGKRIRMLRALACCNRNEFGALLNVSHVTVAAWENGISVITPRNTKNVVAVMSSLSINCSYRWIMGGVGLSPMVFRWDENSNPEFSQQADKSLALEEASYFMSISPGRIVHEIPDNLMWPYYKKGDIVGARVVNKGEVHTLFKKNVVAVMDGGEIFVRTLLPGSLIDCYTLSILQGSQSQSATIINARPRALAEIIWHRSI